MFCGSRVSVTMREILGMAPGSQDAPTLLFLFEWAVLSTWIIEKGPVKRQGCECLAFKELLRQLLRKMLGRDHLIRSC